MCCQLLVAPTALRDIPSYLRAVTLLQPKGNPAAEVAAAVDRLHPPNSTGFPPPGRNEHQPKVDIATVPIRAQSKVRLVLKLAQHTYAGAVGLTLVLLANILNYAGNEGTVLRIIYDHVGIEALKKLDLFIRPSTIVVLMLGYSLTFLWLTRWTGSKLAFAKLLCIATTIFLVFTANIRLGVPSEPELQQILDDKFSSRLSSWTDRVLSYPRFRYWRHERCPRL